VREETTQAATRRLARISGQVRGVSAMVDEGRYCIDIVRQIHAIKSALSSLEAVILDDHLDTCVAEALNADDIAVRTEKVDELVSVLGGRRR